MIRTGPADHSALSILHSDMHLIDTHCHLNHRDFAGDLEAAIDRARQAGVEQMVVIGYDLPSSERAVELADARPELWATVGVHPHHAVDLETDLLARLRGLAAHPRVVAIGEVGLDFYRNLSPADAQDRAFRAQVELALSLGLPVVVHTRDSTPEALALLFEYRDAGLLCLLHCWSGTPEEARRVTDAGWWLGIGGVLTFKNAPQLHAVAAAAPLDWIVLETDAPYLAPQPHRGRRNEPAYLPLVARRLAELKGVDVAEVAAQTCDSSLAVFPRLRAAGEE